MKKTLPSPQTPYDQCSGRASRPSGAAMIRCEVLYFIALSMELPRDQCSPPGPGAAFRHLLRSPWQRSVHIHIDARNSLTKLRDIIMDLSSRLKEKLWTEETGDRRQKIGNRKQKTGDRKQKTGDRRQETGDRASQRRIH
ncbi:hypothetical protein EYF80_040608 [Liparis tanakae]|uniref:Uncharacterized protein n=1 Tax=Liparis tanakae TaxID=230148 RepID=A0A4Z2G6Q0_9TELE|nr:hypothetical protein EYF80_040608 [Liparis tanakae]